MPFGLPIPKPPSNPWEPIIWVVTKILDAGGFSNGNPPPWADDNLPKPKPVPDPQEKPPGPKTPIPPPDNPPAPNPAPPPTRPYDPPVTIPVPIPLPPMPAPVFPTEIDLDQKQHTITHAKRESLVSRRYGCMLYEPVREYINVVACEEDPASFWNAFSEAQTESLRAFLGWLLGWDKLTPAQRENDPQLAAFGTLTALDLIGLDDLLTDKTCELAYVALTLTTRGAFNKLVSANFFVWGCQGLVDLLLWWKNRSKQTVSNFPVIYNTYKTINTVSCIQPEITPTNGLGEVLDYGGVVENTSLVIPDPGDFEFTEGKFMQIHWALEGEPANRYHGLTQLHHPIPELWDCLDSEGNPDPSQVGNLSGNWETYFADLTRKMGYVRGKLYAVERKEAIAIGWFIDENNAKEYFQKLANLTTLQMRETNNPVFTKYADENLFDDPSTEPPETTGEVPKPANLKHEIKNAGKTLIVRKVVIAERLPYLYDPRVLVTYTNTSILVPNGS